MTQLLIKKADWNGRIFLKEYLSDLKIIDLFEKNGYFYLVFEEHEEK